MNYQVDFLYYRCFIQKSLNLEGGFQLVPLSPSSMAGEISTIRKLLKEADLRFTSTDLKNHTANFARLGHSVLLRFPTTYADSYQEAIEQREKEAEIISGSLSVLSANPTIPFCAYAASKSNYGVKYYFPADRIIRHGTNVHGFIDAFPDIVNAAMMSEKISLLLRLYQASLREPDEDHQMLFQLILLEEASDTSSGRSFAERLRSFCLEQSLMADLDFIAKELEFSVPSGKDMVDVLVKLRNCAAHNGKIDRESLREFNGEWLFPLIDEKDKLPRLVGETIRYMFSCLVGHSRDERATRIELGPGESFEIATD